MKLLASSASPAFRTHVWMFAIAAVASWLWPHRTAKRLDLDVGTTRDSFGILDRTTGHLEVWGSIPHGSTRKTKMPR
jgi:hypothetical protein